MNKTFKPRRCRFHKCREWFVPKVRSQKYCGPVHKNADAQRRLRIRAKKFSDQQKQVA